MLIKTFIEDFFLSLTNRDPVHEAGTEDDPDQKIERNHQDVVPVLAPDHVIESREKPDAARTAILRSLQDQKMIEIVGYELSLSVIGPVF